MQSDSDCPTGDKMKEPAVSEDAGTSPTERGGVVEFERLLRQYHKQLLGYIYSLVRDLADAEDLFQQTVLILWKKFATFDRQYSFLAWGCGIARLEVSNYLRVRRRNRLYFSDDLNLLLAEAHADVRGEDFESRQEALRACVQKLRERDRELVKSCYGIAHGVMQVAAATGRSAPSVHNSLRRIRRALYECIERTLNQINHPEVIG
jgi:RNA polymerase sigma-70 factor, ECF subfamily